MHYQDLSGYRIFYRRMGEPDIKGLMEVGMGNMIIPVPLPNDFYGLDESGQVMAIELPAGDYEIYSWNLTSGLYDVKTRDDFNIKVRLTEKKATYVGSYLFRTTDRRGLTVTGASLDYRDCFERDTEIFLQKYSNIRMDQVVKGIEDEVLVKDIGNGSEAHFNFIPLFLMPGVIK